LNNGGFVASGLLDMLYVSVSVSVLTKAVMIDFGFAFSTARLFSILAICAFVVDICSRQFFIS
jgi:hypothetical protein